MICCKICWKKWCYKTTVVYKYDGTQEENITHKHWIEKELNILKAENEEIKAKILKNRLLAAEP